MTDPDPNPFDEAFLAGLPRLELAARRLVSGDGDAALRAPRRGGRVEFAEHRAYVPGDDLRHIDWSAFARSGRLFVKEFERRDEISLLLVLDDSASMRLGAKLFAAKRLAYALAFFALAGGHRVRAALAAGGELRTSAEVASRARMQDVAAFLASAQGGGATRLSESLRGLPPRAARGRLLVMLSDLWSEDDGRDALALRARAGDEVVVFHVASAEDLRLPGDFVVAEDAETGERRLLGPDAAGGAAIDAARREAGWRAFAARHRMTYLPVDAATPTFELLRRNVRETGLVR